MRFRCLLLILVFMLMPSMVWSGEDCTINDDECTVTCDNDSGDAAHFTSAISDVAAGAIIHVTGTCNITSTVVLDKALTLFGAGTTSWTGTPGDSGSSATWSGGPTLNGAADPLINIKNLNSGFVRISGMYFYGAAGVDTLLRLYGANLRVRIDNNSFGPRYYGVRLYGRAEGVTDNNVFTNCDRCVFHEAASGQEECDAWELDFDYGTGNFLAGAAGNGHFMFYENNYFLRNASFTQAGNELHYNQEGARTIFRYNTVDMSAWSGNNYAWECHGNQEYYDENPCNNFRGNPIWAVYNNYWKLQGSPRVIAPRSGSGMFFNNVITVINVGRLTQLVHLVEEETYDGGHFEGKSDTVWPNEDMITDTFIWNNTVNGAALTTSNMDGYSTYPDEARTINLNRDVWMHAPQSSGGRTYYNGRPGASGRNADGTLVFTQSGANAYYPYTPYTYPHPLRKISPPKRFRFWP